MTKLLTLQIYMQTGQWEKAIKYAAKFPQLGTDRDAILTASSVLLSPSFYLNIGQDPQILIDKGISALKHRFSIS